MFDFQYWSAATMCFFAISYLMCHSSILFAIVFGSFMFSLVNFPMEVCISNCKSSVFVLYLNFDLALSKWCISYRKKARQIVETWEKMFSSSMKEKRISFLYLANDILQNSRRKGSEFVNEFWKLLPRALKSVIESGDDHGKTVVTRLVTIWDERKVFGSRGQVLKDKMLGDESTPVLENNGKSSQPIKMVKKDAQTIRFKLAVGGMPEKIVTAFQSVHDEHFNEDAALNKCNAAVSSVRKTEKDVEDACAQGNQQVSSALASELQEQEMILKQCIEQLEGIEATRATLVSQLKEALQEQESKLELTCSQLQVARAEMEHASNMRQRLTSASSQISNTLPVDTGAAEYELHNQASNVQPQQSSQPITSFMSSFAIADEQHKKAAAAVAAKLAASTSSEQILNSVLSSFVAEEAASKNGGVKTESFTNSPPVFSMAKRAKLEKPVAVPEMGNTYLGHVSQQQLPSVPPMPSQASITSYQPMVQMNPPQPPFPPPPSLPPPLPPTQQYLQTSGVMVGVAPYGYGTNSLPPPPVQSHVLMGLARANAPQSAALQPPGLPPPQLSQQQQQQQQQVVTTGFNQPPGMNFFGQPAATPVPRQ